MAVLPDGRRDLRIVACATGRTKAERRGNGMVRRSHTRRHGTPHTSPADCVSRLASLACDTRPSRAGTPRRSLIARARAPAHATTQSPSSEASKRTRIEPSRRRCPSANVRISERACQRPRVSANVRVSDRACQRPRVSATACHRERVGQLLDRVWWRPPELVADLRSTGRAGGGDGVAVALAKL